jgi:hypothetical protein
MSDYKSKEGGPMDQTDKNAQGWKPKIYKPAILSPLIVILGVLLAIASCYMRIPYALTIFIVLMAGGLLLGIIACWKIHKSRGALKGYVFSISGLVLIAIIFTPVLLPSLFFPHPCVAGTCGSNIAGLGKAMLLYAYEYDGRYPTPDRWCDLLVKYEDIYEGQYVCRDALKRGDKGRCHYAINPNCDPNSPGDTVLLFETKGGWNQYGGPELLTTEHLDGIGCNILFNDTHVRFIKTEQLSELKWDNKPKEGQKQ